MQFNKLHVHFNNFCLQSPSFADPALNQRGAAPILWFSKPQYSELRHGWSQLPKVAKSESDLCRRSTSYVGTTSTKGGLCHPYSQHWSCVQAQISF